MIPPEKLYTYGRFITETELQKIIREGDYRLFHRGIEDMIESGWLSPVKASGSNGRIPPLFNKYRIIKPREDYAGYMESIRRLNPRLNISDYLKRPELYKKHLEIVEGLSRYLWYEAGLLEQPMSRKERSFSIWGREKLLDKQLALVREVLRFNGLEEGCLNYYDTPEPFFEYVHSPTPAMSVLIIENKDTWFSFRKLMQATRKNVIAGIAVDLLLYGEGNKITKKGALEDYAAGMLGRQEEHTIKFMYFGDLDLEGIRLFFRTRDANPGLSIQPFAPLYQLMLELAQGRTMPESPDKRGIPAEVEGFAYLGGLQLQVISSLLAEGCYIPQEIVNFQVLADILS
ncbi:MAG: DUF2220 family protein [Syntrophomonadaceae bacterium]|nr:DUF2220 family protein [Syntrophomonadaceae bacterium]